MFNAHSNPYLIDNVNMHASNDNHAAISLSHVNTSGWFSRFIPRCVRDKNEAKHSLKMSKQTHETLQEISQKTQEKNEIDKSDYHVHEYDYHTYNSELLRLSFDERMQNLASLGSKGKNGNSLACLRNAGSHSAESYCSILYAYVICCLVRAHKNSSVIILQVFSLSLSLSFPPSLPLSFSPSLPPAMYVCAVL